MFKQVKLAIAPLTWTNDDLPKLGAENTFEQCISEMALAGYAGCEVGNKFPRDPKVLKEALDLRGLQVCNQWFSFRFTTHSFSQVKAAFAKHLDFLGAMGARIVGGAEVGNSIQGNQRVGVFSHKPNFTEEQWKKVARSFNELGKYASGRGFKLCYHHHMGTGVQTSKEVDRLLDMTDSRYVFLNFDTGHFYYSGEDPNTLIKKYLSYVKHIHLKDIRKNILQKTRKYNYSFLKSVREGVFTIPGDGVIDFSKFFNAIKKDYYGWMVVEAEQDPAKAHPLLFAKNSRAFIRKKTGL